MKNEDEASRALGLLARAPTDPTIFEGESQEFNITYHDPDGDSLTIQWHQNGSLVGSDDSYIFAAEPDSAGVYNVTIAVSDGLEQVSHEWMPTVQFDDAYLVVRGLDNRIYYRLYNASGSSWESWNALPGATCDSPAAALLGNDLHIVVCGLDGNTLWHGYLADPSDPESFSGWSSLSGATSSAPTLTS